MLLWHLLRNDTFLGKEHFVERDGGISHLFQSKWGRGGECFARKFHHHPAKQQREAKRNIDFFQWGFNVSIAMSWIGWNVQIATRVIVTWWVWHWGKFKGVFQLSLTSCMENLAAGRWHYSSSFTQSRLKQLAELWSGPMPSSRFWGWKLGLCAQIAALSKEILMPVLPRFFCHPKFHGKWKKTPKKIFVAFHSFVFRFLDSQF